ncbi:MAG: aldo/keto reductase [Proteobacteria bacterium]|nr:aldo/keto reductase [Pseudomonadota bacterium]
MKKRTLGRTNLEVSVIGFGGIPIQRLSLREAEKVLCTALDRGINFLDTARGYTDSEDKIGRAISSRRGEFVLASKAMSRKSANMTGELDASLKKLRTDMIDLYQFHCVGTDEQLEKVLGPGGAYEALDKARAHGKVRYIGISGHVRDVLEKAVNTGLFDTVQLPFNPMETDSLEDVIPAAKAASTGIIAMKPVAGGALRNRAPLALRFTLTHGADVVIPGMETTDQVEKNAAAGDELTPLTDEELSTLEEDKAAWKGRFCRRCGYCLPCEQGLDIPSLFLLDAYYTRYELKDWALKRLLHLEKKYADCVACGECMERCPYKLEIPDLMAKAAKTVV